MFASWQESYDRPRQCVEKQRHYSADKGLSSQGCGLPSGHVRLRVGPSRRLIAEELMSSNCGAGKTLESPLDSKEIQPSILREIKGLMLKLKLQYFGHLMRTADSLEKSLILGKIEGRRRGCQRMRRLDGISEVKDTNLGKLWGMVSNREAWYFAVHGVTKG